MDTETISRIKYITRKLSWMIPFLLLIFISLFSLPGITLPNRDSSVFQYAGAQMLAGKIPYLDFWDHKGPLIFVVNALGAWIHGGDPSGVWLVELVLLARDGGAVAPVAAGYLSPSALAQADGYMLVPAESEGCPAGARIDMRLLP